MPRGKKRLLLALISVFAILSAVVITLFFLLPPEKGELENFLARADRAINAGLYFNARDELQGAASAASGEYDFLKILKRSYQICTQMQNFASFNKLALMALEKHPRKHRIVSLAFYGALETGDLPLVDKLAREKRKRDVLDSFLLESSLVLEKPKYRENIDGLYAPLKKLLDEPSAALYLDMGKKWGDTRLVANGALFLMAEGEKELAYKLFRENLSAPLYDSRAALVAYDNGDLEMAIYRIRGAVENGQWSHKAMLGDFYLLSGQYELARSYYLKSLAQKSEGSATVYLNLSALYQKTGETDSAGVILDEGLRFFPGNPELALEKTKLLKARGQIGEAEAFSSRFLQEKGFSSSLELLNIILRREQFSQPDFIMSLWQVFHQERENPVLCRFLTNQLLLAGDPGEGEKAINLFAAQTGVESYPWLYHFRGIILASQGNFQGSLDYLGRSLEIEEDPYVRYNRGIILIFLGEWSRGLEDFSILTSAAYAGENQEFYSLCLMNLGRCYMNLGQESRARVQLEKALRIDPDNYSALLLLKRLQD